MADRPLDAQKSPAGGPGFETTRVTEQQWQSSRPDVQASSSSDGHGHGLLARWKLSLKALADPRLSKADVSVLARISDHVSSETGEAFPAVSRLAALAGIAERSVIRSAKRLVECGYLTSRQIAGRPTRYKLATPDAAVTPDNLVTPDAIVTPPLTRLSQAPDKAVTPTPDKAVTLSCLKHPEEPNQTTEPNKKPRARKARAEGLPGEDFEKFWTAYPRKEGRADAVKAWAQVKASATEILADVEKSVQRVRWSEQRFTPLPGRYLRGRRWLDEWQQPTPQASRHPGRLAPVDEAQAELVNRVAEERLRKNAEARLRKIAGGAQ